MRGELKRLQHQLGTTTIYVTHDQAEAMTLASRVAVMRKGRLQQFDTPMNIYNCPANRFVAEFVGSPSMNFIEGERATIGIRPEHIQVFSEPRDGAIEASVYVTELMGNETFVFLSVGTNRLIARAPADFRAEVESKVWLHLAKDKMHYFDPVSGNALLRNTDRLR
jgi:ABC-type sugar transport system ATPase subunit